MTSIGSQQPDRAGLEVTPAGRASFEQREERAAEAAKRATNVTLGLLLPVTPTVRLDSPGGTA